MKLRYRKQRGAVTLVGALFIIITLALMIQVLHRTAGSDMLDSAVQSDSVEAFFIAESGLEHAAALYSVGNCDTGLATTAINVGRGNFTIENLGAGFNNDFSGLVLPASNCRIRVTGVVPTLGVQRVVEGIFGKEGNLLGSANADFNDPWPCSVCTPTGWSLPADGWQNNAGQDGAGDRAAYVNKPTNGPTAVTTAGAYGLTAFTVTAPVTLTLNYDFKVTGTSPGNSDKATYTFSVWDGTNLYSSAPDPSKYTSGWVSGSVSLPVTGSGPVTITEFRFVIEAKAGQVTQAWLDNLDLRGPGGGGTGAELLQWRELVSN